jgi:hypothetical protein
MRPRRPRRRARARRAGARRRAAPQAALRRDATHASARSHTHTRTHTSPQRTVRAGWRFANEHRRIHRCGRFRQRSVRGRSGRALAGHGRPVARAVDDHRDAVHLVAAARQLDARRGSGSVSGGKQSARVAREKRTAASSASALPKVVKPKPRGSPVALRWRARGVSGGAAQRTALGFAMLLGSAAQRSAAQRRTGRVAGRRPSPRRRRRRTRAAAPRSCEPQRRVRSAQKRAHAPCKHAGKQRARGTHSAPLAW